MFPIKNVWAVVDILSDISAAAATYSQKLVSIQEKITQLKSNEQLMKVADDINNGIKKAEKIKKLAQDVAKAEEDAREAIAEIEERINEDINRLSEISEKSKNSIEEAREILEEREAEAKNAYDAAKKLTRLGDRKNKEDQDNESDDDFQNEFEVKDNKSDGHTQNELERQLSGRISDKTSNNSANLELPVQLAQENQPDKKNIVENNPKNELQQVPEKGFSFPRNRLSDSKEIAVKEISSEMKQKISQETLKTVTQINDFMPVALPDKNVSFVESDALLNKKQLEKQGITR